MSVLVIYTGKEGLYPRFGQANTKSLNPTIWIRGDLPEPVKKFVEEHERYHLRDKATWWVWREIKANFYGAWKHPWGFVMCVVMSLAWYRLRYYWERVKRGE